VPSVKRKDTEKMIVQCSKKESRSEANVMRSDDNDSDSSCFSLSITPSGCHSDESEWVLDTGSTYHICPRRELFASFEEIDGGLMSMGDGHTFRLVGKIQFVSECTMGH